MRVQVMKVMCEAGQEPQRVKHRVEKTGVAKIS